ncbi:MAG: hypothetical protein QXT76_02475, partial [Sulfolobales archaeon]
MSILGFINLGAPFVSAYVIGPHSFRVTPTYSSPSSSSSSRPWGNPYILALNAHPLGSSPHTSIVGRYGSVT